MNITEVKHNIGRTVRVTGGNRSVGETGTLLGPMDSYGTFKDWATVKIGHWALSFPAKDLSLV